MCEREVRRASELRRTKILFLKDKANLTDRERIRFDTIKNANYDVSRAWRIKENFRDIMHAADSRAAAAVLLVMWRNEAVKAGIPETTKVANMFYGHIHGVVNARHLEETTEELKESMETFRNSKPSDEGLRTLSTLELRYFSSMGDLVLHKDFFIC